MFANHESFVDLYAILDVNQNATQAEIKTAYKKKAVLTHPDKNHTTDATEKFTAIQNAYEILSDEQKRLNYNREYNLHFSLHTSTHAKRASAPVTPPQKPVNLEDLRDLVSKHDLVGIAQVIERAKAKEGWRWQHTDKYYVETALRDAILLGQLDTVALFLQTDVYASGSAPGKKGGGHYSYIYFAASSGNLDMVKLLVEQGAEIKPHNSYYNEGDDSGIDAAVKFGHAHIVDYLLEKGATARGVLGGYRRDTFLGHAAKHNRFAIIDSLLRHGAKPSLENSFGLAAEKYGERISNYQRQLENQYQEENRQDILKKIASGSEWMRQYYQDQLKQFDETKEKLQQTLQKYSQYYASIVKNLLDYAIGVDLSKESYSGLNFLRHLNNVAGLNFVGVSLGGYPITREMLLAEKLQGVSEAIVSLSDLAKLENPVRRLAIQERLQTAMQQQGVLIRNDHVNLVPLWRSAEVGDLEAVKIRLAAGINPNEVGDDSPIVLAIKNNHEEIVKILRAHPQFDVKSLAAAIKAAQQANNVHLAEYLIDTQDINQADKKGDTLLHHAVRAGKVDEVKKLIEKDYTKLNGRKLVEALVQHL